MPRRYAYLAWTAAISTYLLIVLGGIVRITGSGMGCGDHWPLCNGRLFPPLDDLGTLIEWSHRLLATVVSVLIAGLAGYSWWLRRLDRLDRLDRPGRAAFVALALLVVQVGLGAVTVKLELPPWTVILHLGTAMLVLAALLVATRPTPGNGPETGSRALRAPGWRPGLVILGLTFATVLLGALTANLGAAAACGGFPLCNGQVIPTGGALAQIHWTHRLLAYALTAVVAWWAWRVPGRAPRVVLSLVVVQVAVGAWAVLSGLPGGLQALHLAVGTAVWAAVVLGQ